MQAGRVSRLAFLRLMAGGAGAVALKSENPILGGTVLRRAAIQTPNFIAGSQGWIIRQDGSAEFNNVVIRNGQVVSGTALYYSPNPGLGNLIASVAAAAGVDQYGNAYVRGTASYSGGLLSVLDAGNLSFHSQNAGSLITADGQLFLTDAQAANVAPALHVLSPYTGTTRAVLVIYGGSQDGSKLAQVVLSGPAGGGGVPLTPALLEIQGPEAIQAAGGGLLKVTETGGAPASPPSQIISKTAGDRAFGVEVLGDPNFRFRIDSNGRHDWGPGSAVADTDLFRALAATLQTDGSLAFTNEVAPAAVAGAGQLFGIGGQLAQVNASGQTGRLSSGKLAGINTVTVTQAAFNNLFNDTIKASDAVVGAVYKLTAHGFGTWGSTQQTLTFAARFGATDASTVGSTEAIDATALAANAAFRWECEATVECVTTGATATWFVKLRGCVTQSANNIIPGTAANNSVPFAGGTGSGGPVTLDSTVDEIFGISAKWAATTGAPTITKQGGWLERVA